MADVFGMMDFPQSMGEPESVTAILDQSPIGVTIVGSDLSIRYANAHLAQMVAIDPAQGAWPLLDHFIADADDRLLFRAALTGGQGLARRD